MGAGWLRKVSDTDLVFSLLGQLRCRISLALALTVRNLTVEECRSGWSGQGLQGVESWGSNK